MLFNNACRRLGDLTPRLVREIKAETMVFAYDASDARSLSRAPITNEFLDVVGATWGSLKGVVIDSRTHMLFPGMYPCIPGWHTDEAPRDPAVFAGQPDITCKAFQAEHILVAIDAGTESMTEFAVSSFSLNIAHIVDTHARTGQHFYRTADETISSLDPETIRVSSGEAVEFDCFSWHRGMPAKGNGWRFFIRATRNAPRKVLNEIRTQVQVYMPTVNVGW